MMAWLDNRVWCHPKLVSVSYKARWTWVAGVTYSNGFETLGRLTAGQQKAIGSDAKVRRELVDVGLWDEDGDGAIVVHDWSEHNSERDERRAAARERKRQQRERDKARDNERDKEEMSRVTSVTDSVTKRVTSRTRVRAPDEGSEEEDLSQEQDQNQDQKRALAVRNGQALEHSPQALVAHFVDEARKVGSDPPKRVTGQVARLIGELVREGVSAEKISAGIDLLIERRLHPSALPSAVHEAAMPPPGPRRGGRLSASQVLENAHRLQKEGR